MKSILAGLFILSFGLSMDAAGQTAKSPNVIFVLTDDQGYADLSRHGNPVLQTPYLDKFYDESIRFSDFHVAPLCTPTRGELLSGQDALRNRASTVLSGRGILKRDLVTMPEIFRQNGYHTGLFGKWHLGDTYPDRPMDKGFDKATWIKGWGLLSEIEYDNDYYKTRYIDSIELKYSEKYCTDLWFDEAMAWMDKMAGTGKPFFAFLPLNAAHGPFQGPKSKTDFYKGKVPDNNAANFFGMIANIDENMNRLDRWLESKGLLENTIVIFMTDNGGTAGVKVYNAGMRGEKATNYEGGHRAIFMLRWPKGNLGKARTLTEPATAQDVLPTLTELLNFKVRKPHSFDGVSLVKLLTKGDDKLNKRMFVIQHTAGITPEKYAACVVFDKWRLIGDTALYDLRTDPGQIQNVIAQQPAVHKAMKKFYEKWWSGLGDGFDDIVPVVIGSPEENPVILNSNSWSGKGINTQWGVAQGMGEKKGGLIHVHATASGNYKIELGRWPFHLGRALTQIGPSESIGGTGIREGRALPIAKGLISINKGTPFIAPATDGAAAIVFNVSLKKGDNTLQSWFADKDGNDICGAYYVRVTKL